jgi:hypothetical protein
MDVRVNGWRDCTGTGSGEMRIIYHCLYEILFVFVADRYRIELFGHAAGRNALEFVNHMQFLLSPVAFLSCTKTHKDYIACPPIFMGDTVLSATPRIGQIYINHSLI